MYIWERAGWPALNWDERGLTKLVSRVSRAQGRLHGQLEAIGFELRNDAHVETLTEDVVKSSEIEGENLDRQQVRSSVARRLGLDRPGLVASNRDVEGVVELTLDATSNYAEPLTTERLFAWHAALFPTGRQGMRKIRVGEWRDDADGPMQVVSGAIGHERIHFRAPPAERVPEEMAAFLTLFETPGEMEPLLIAGLAHFSFVTIHPFEDGNGRIGRAIADMALARSEESHRRFYSMSSQIRQERKDYYAVLERTQRGELDITGWQTWFLECLLRAIEAAQETLRLVLDKARFWDRFAKEPLNERQIKVLNKLLDAFEGKLTSSKWAKLAKCSQDTAYRDILDLLKRGALRKDAAGGRSTSYSLVLSEPTSPK